MDVVWMRLSVLSSAENGALKDNAQPEDELIMFGPTGVVRVGSLEGKTALFNSNKTIVALVSEDQSYIMDTLGRIRGTKGLLDGSKKQSKKTGSKARSRKTKA